MCDLKDFYSFAEIMYTIQDKKYTEENEGKVYLDLGSGSGKSVIASALLCNFTKCFGIEFLKSLDDFAKGFEAELYESKEYVVKEMKRITGNSEWKLPEISLVNGDFLEVDWDEADIIFVNSTCFENSLMNCIAVKASLCKKGTIMITLTKEVPDPDNWTLRDQFRRKMSWGEATVFVQTKSY